MDLAFDLLQGAGLGLAIGIRPFLPALLAGALASGELGVDFDGTSLAWLEASGFLLALLLGILAYDAASRRLGPERLEKGAGGIGLAMLAVGLAGLFGAGSLEDRGHPPLLGAAAAIACAVLALITVRALLARVRRRLDPAAQGTLPLYAETAAVLVAALSVLFPPFAVLCIAGVAWLLVAGRRRSDQKYAGLRILR